MSVSKEQVRPYISNQYSDEQVRELVECHIDPDTIGQGIARARISGRGTTVAAMIDYLEAVDGDVQQAADAYDLSLEQTLAAIFFYWEYQEIIDAEITVRRSYFSEE